MPPNISQQPSTDPSTLVRELEGLNFIIKFYKFGAIVFLVVAELANLISLLLGAPDINDHLVVVFLAPLAAMMAYGLGSVPPRVMINSRIVSRFYRQITVDQDSARVALETFQHPFQRLICLVRVAPYQRIIEWLSHSNEGLTEP